MVVHVDSDDGMDEDGHNPFIYEGDFGSDSEDEDPLAVADDVMERWEEQLKLSPGRTPSFMANLRDELSLGG